MCVKVSWFVQWIQLKVVPVLEKIAFWAACGFEKADTANVQYITKSLAHECVKVSGFKQWIQLKVVPVLEKIAFWAAYRFEKAYTAKL